MTPLLFRKKALMETSHRDKEEKAAKILQRMMKLGRSKKTDFKNEILTNH